MATVIFVGSCRALQGEPCVLEFELEPEPESVYAEPTECDPFVMPPTTPHIQPPVVVARAADGQVYVIDRLDHGYGRPGVDGVLHSRLFVADAQTLVRVPGGTGGSQSTPTHIYASFGSADGAISGLIRLERKPGYPENITPSETAVVVFETPPAGGPAIEEVFDEGTPLEVLSECEATGYAVEDLEQSRRIEYVAEDELGNLILVAVPAIDWDVQSATLFYGPPDAVLQRPVLAFGRRRDGGTTDIRFDYEGAESTLRFQVGCNGPFTHDCEGTLQRPDGALSVSIPSKDPALLEGKTFLCHDASAE